MSISLNNIKELMKITLGKKMSQLDFMKELLPEQVNQLLPARQASSYRITLSDFFNKGKRGRIAELNYRRLRNSLTDKNHYFKTNVIRNLNLKVLCYVEDVTLWTESRPASVYGAALLPKREKDSYSPVEVLVKLLEADTEDFETELTYRAQAGKLYHMFKQNEDKEMLNNLLSYGILCALFPDPNLLNARNRYC